jgi:ADP-heptose:LPS heptosyltransferase
MMSALSPTQRGRIQAAARARRVLDLVSRVTPRPAPRSTVVERIGVLMQWGIGDAVLALPLLRALHETFPGAAIELIGKPFLQDLFRGERFLGTYRHLVPPWTAPSRKYALWQPQWRRYALDLMRLRKVTFDILVSPRFDPRDNVQARLIRARSVVGFAAAGGKEWFAIDFGLSAEDIQRMPRIAVNGLIAKALGASEVNDVPGFARPGDASKAPSEIVKPARQSGASLAISFGAAHPIRRWNVDKIEAILGRLRDKLKLVIVISNPGDADSDIKVPAGVASMNWRSDLQGVMGLLRQVDLLFCADSGVMHIAAAVGTPTVAIFGPTSPHLFGPSGDGHEVIAIEPMPCRPCYDACIYQTPKCLDQIDLDMVVERLDQAIDKVLELKRD